MFCTDMHRNIRILEILSGQEVRRGGGEPPEASEVLLFFPHFPLTIFFIKFSGRPPKAKDNNSVLVV